LKPERWGSPLVQEKYQEEKSCDKRHPYRIIIIAFVERENKCVPVITGPSESISKYADNI